jgi:aryl-phospho-beta-D-glucosidase BglC (GH1 family)
MNYRKLLQSILGTILVVLFTMGCNTPTVTPVAPTTALTPKPLTSTPIITPTSKIILTPTVAPGGFPRRFHVEGNAFVDQFGQKMVFRGMASPDVVQMVLHEHAELSAWNAQYYQAMASWGANIIRVPITPYGLHKVGTDRMLTIMDQTIAWAGENKMYVIIDFHSCGWFPDNWSPTVETRPR